MSDNLDIIIGLEVHVQLTKLRTKLFCACSSDYRGKPQNTYTCPICLGLPGSLPVINEKAIEFATRLALALKCKINQSMYFFRKNYFYPDLPKGFQITQYNRGGGKAFADGGIISIKINDVEKDIQLNRIHLEEDPARLVHEGSIKTSPHALVDYNRSGTTLIEIVSEPDMSSPAEAREYLKQLLSIIQYTGICDTNLEGAFRVDANISIRGHKRSEVKNINSIREVERALKWEAERQGNALKNGKTLFQETRHWDGQITISLRIKESEADYRYFPEEDLVPIVISRDYIEKVKSELPEMPEERKIRFQEKYGLSSFDASILVLDKDISDFFDIGVKSEKSFSKNDYKQFCNWLMGDISGWLNDNSKNITETRLVPKQLVDLLKAIKEKKVSGKMAKEFVNDMMIGTPVATIIKKSGKQVISDEGEITKLIHEVMAENQKIVEDFKKNPKAIQALIGKVMGKTRGQADPELTRELMEKFLNK